MMSEESSFEQSVDDAHKGKTDRDIRDWYLKEIVDREQMLSYIEDRLSRGAQIPPVFANALKRELHILSSRACGWHSHAEIII